MSMDKKIKQSKWRKAKVFPIVLGLSVAVLSLYGFLFAEKGATLKVDLEKITLSEVNVGTFQEIIPETGLIMPSHTTYLDAIEGGVIKRILLEAGALVKVGDTILILSNSNLQMEVMNREAQLYEQLNLLRSTKLQLDQNNLSQKGQLAEIDYQLQLLKPQYDRLKELAGKKLIANRDLEEVEEQYEYNRKRRLLTYEAYKSDSISRIVQLKQINLSELRMIKSLEAVGKILDNLVITATTNGLLTTPDWEPGQSISVGERLGQIAKLDNFKVRVAVDELYLPRVNVGKQGSFEFDGNNYRLEVIKKYPTVSEGSFEVDMEFIGKKPKGIRRGQSLRIKLELSNAKQTVLIPTGGFYQSTGGNWIYKLNDNGDKAERTEIQLGRKSFDSYEVIDGLEPGDKVITSSYDNFGDNEVLVF